MKKNKKLKKHKMLKQKEIEKKKHMGEGGVDTLEIVFIIKNTFLKVKRRSGREERENNEN